METYSNIRYMDKYRYTSAPESRMKGLTEETDEIGINGEKIVMIRSFYYHHNYTRSKDEWKTNAQTQQYTNRTQYIVGGTYE